MELTAIITMMAVKNTPNTIFNHLFIAGFSRTDKETINAGIARNTDAVNNFAGLSNK